MVGEALFEGISTAPRAPSASTSSPSSSSSPPCCCSPARRSPASLKATSDTVTTSHAPRARRGHRSAAASPRSSPALEEPSPRACASAKPKPAPEPMLDDEPDWADDRRDRGARGARARGARRPPSRSLAEDEEAEGVEKIAADAARPHPAGPLPRQRHRRPGLQLAAARPGLPQAVHRGGRPRPTRPARRRPPTALVEALGHFGVDARVIAMVAGPHITRYELRLAPGTKVAKVAQLKDDLAYALAASDIRVLAPIPGKQAVGVEVPNARRRIVHLGDVLTAPPEDWSPLTVCLGKDVAGRAINADLAKMPHLLVAGTTGAGKSGCVNAMLSSRPAQRDAARGADGAGRPQAGRAQPLRVDPAPAHAGDHVAAQGRHRAAEPRARDGAALRADVAGPHALADRAQQGARRRAARRRCPTSCASSTSSPT